MSTENNLPVIEENSLHRIVSIVKLYQVFNQLKMVEFEKACKKLTGLDKICYENYYKNGCFFLINKPNSDILSLLNELSESKKKTIVSNNGEGFKKFLQDKIKNGERPENRQSENYIPIGDYLEVFDDNVQEQKITSLNQKIGKIKSKKPFFWKKWDGEEEDLDWNGDIIYDFEINMENVIIGEISFDGNYHRSIEFKKPLIIESCFLVFVQFKSCIFNDFLKFCHNKIEDKTSFYNTDFNCYVNFCDTYFGKEKANFTYTKYNFEEGYACEFERSKFPGGVSFDCSRFMGMSNLGGLTLSHSSFKNIAFVKYVSFDETKFMKVDFGETNFFDSVCFDDCTFHKQVGFQNNYFGSADIIRFDNLNLLGGKIVFRNNQSSREIEINSEQKTLGKAFRDSPVSFSIAEATEDSSITFSYCDFRNFENWKETLQNLKSKTNLIIDENCEPKPFQKTVQIVSNKILADFLKDLTVAFDYYLQIKFDKTVDISVSQIEKGFSVDLEFADEELNNNFEFYEHEFKKFLENPTLGLSSFSSTDKNILASKFSAVFVSQVYLLKNYLEFGIIKENEAKGFLEPLKNLIKTPKLLNFNLNFMFNLFSNNKTAKDNGIIADNHSTVNQLATTTPTTQEILQLLDKFLEYKTDKPDEKEALENIQQAKLELENGNQEKAKNWLKKAWWFIVTTGVAITTGTIGGAGGNLVSKFLEPFLGLK